MSKKSLLALTSLAFVMTTTAAAQAPPSDAVRNHEKEALFAFFAGLANGEWQLTGTWSSGDSVNWVQRHELALGGRIVKTQKLSSEGVADGGLEVRNEGIRAWDETAGEMRFWEFDRPGGITTGRAGLHNGALYYEYSYPISGRMRTLRDEWRKREDGAYDHRVGIWENGAWGQVFLNGVFRRR